MLDSTPRVLDSSAELARVGLRGARLDPRLLDSSAESSNLGHESYFKELTGSLQPYLSFQMFFYLKHPPVTAIGV